jgi:hypothetical protein
MLAPELQAEYRRLGRLIRDISAELRDNSAAGLYSPTPGIPPRIPLVIHKEKLIEFLRKRTSASRPEIIRAIQIPPGSLGSLLRSGEFEQVSHGRWALKKDAK